MIKQNVQVIIIFILAVFFTGCNFFSSDDESSINYKITGTVTDTSGNPLSDVKIFIEYYTQTNQAKPETQITFNLPGSGPMKLWITPFFSSDTVVVLIDDTLGTGQHNISWKATNSYGKIISNNFYYYHIKTQGTYTKQAFFFNYFLPNDYINYQEIASTNVLGNYTININELAFSFPDNLITNYDENGDVISTSHVTRNIKLWVIDGIHERKCVTIENIPSNQNVIYDIVLANRK